MKHTINIFIGIGLICSFLLPACKQEIEDYVPKEYIGSDASYLRVINTASIPRRINFSINGQKINGDSLGFLSSFPTSEYLRAPSGNLPFSVTIAATGAEVYSSSLNFPQGKYNTLFILDTLPMLDAYLVTDDYMLPPADSGKALIRFVHVAKGAGNLTLANTTTATAIDSVVKNQSFKTHSNFIKVNAGSAQKFQLYQAGTTTKVGPEMTGVNLSANRIYTIYARGRAGTTSAYPVGLSIILNR